MSRVVPNTPTNRQETTVHPRVTDYTPHPQPIVVHEVVDEHTIRVPRFFRCTGTPPPPPPEKATTTFRGELRSEQVDVAARALAGLRASGGCFLVLPTGFGKTVLAMYLAAALGCTRVVVVTPTIVLKRQWIERSERFFDGGHVEATTVHSYDPFSATDLLVLDETHRYAAPTFSKIWKNEALYVLGLSATPDRADGTSVLLDWICGPRVTSSVLEAPKTQVTVEVMFTGVLHAVDHHSVFLTKLATDRARTAKIVARIRDMRDALVVSHRRQQCRDIHDALANQGKDVGLMIGGSHDVPPNSIIVGTYSMVSEGFDCPRLSSLVLCTPISAPEQIVGRILRTPGKKLVVDVVDDGPIARAQYAKRRAVYLARGYNVTANRQEWAFID